MRIHASLVACLEICQLTIEVCNPLLQPFSKSRPEQPRRTEPSETAHSDRAVDSLGLDVGGVGGQWVDGGVLWVSGLHRRAFLCKLLQRQHVHLTAFSIIRFVF